MKMTPRERIFAALRLQEVDRPPLMLWGLDPYLPPYDPSYKPLLDYIRENVEIKRRWSPSGGGLFFSAAKVEIISGSKTENGITARESTIKTPKGDLNAISRSVPGTFASAEIKRYISSQEDIEKFLSLPYEPIKTDVSSFFNVYNELGERGVVTFRTSDPMGVVGGIYDPEEFVLACVLQKDIVKKMLDAMFERIFAYYKSILEGGARPIFIIQGPEYISPPLLPPEYFDDLVVEHDRKLVRLIHDYGCHVIIHCHGNMNAIIEKFIEIGTDGLHPVESPPLGDIALADAKHRIGDRICIVGNIQIGDMFDCSADEIAEKCRQLIKDGGKNGLIIAITATPYEKPLSERTFQNYIRLIETGKQYRAL